MGVFDKFIKLELKSTEAKAIVDMIRENDLRGRKVYFDNLFYHAAVEKDGEMDYIRKDILYVTLPNDGYFYTDLIFSLSTRIRINK